MKFLGTFSTIGSLKKVLGSKSIIITIVIIIIIIIIIYLFKVDFYITFHNYKKPIIIV